MLKRDKGEANTLEDIPENEGRFKLRKKDQVEETAPVEEASIEQETVETAETEVKKKSKTRGKSGKKEKKAQKFENKDGETPEKKAEKAERKGRFSSGGGEKLSEEEQKQRKINELCNNIRSAFKNEQSGTITDGDFEKIATFLFQNNRFSLVSTIAEEQRGSILNIVSALTKVKTTELLRKKDLNTLRTMYQEEFLAGKIAQHNLSLNDDYTEYIQGNTKEVEDIPDVIRHLKDAFPDDPYYTRAIDNAGVEVAVDYANADMDECKEFAELDVQYNRYKTNMPLMLASERFRNIYTERFKAIIDKHEQIEVLNPIYEHLGMPGLNAFLVPSKQALDDRMDVLVKGYMDKTDSVEHLNTAFNRAPPAVKTRVDESYYKNTLRILGAKKDVESSSIDFRGVDWTYMHGPDWQTKVVNTYCQSVVEQLVHRDEDKISDLEFVPKDDHRVYNTIAEIVINPVADGRIKFNALYAWQEYFSRVEETQSVRRVKSKICLEIGKGLMDTDPDIALSYFSKAEFENLGGLEVYAVLIMAQNSLKAGDEMIAMRYAREASVKNATMTCAGKAMMAYVANLGESPTEMTFKDAVSAFKAEVLGLDPILTKVTLDNLARAYMAGNLSSSELILRDLMHVDCPKSDFFLAFAKTVEGIEMFNLEQYDRADELFKDSTEKHDDVLYNINLVGHTACMWTRKEVTPGSLKTTCDEVLRKALLRIDKWFCYLVSGLVDERQLSWNYAVDKYTKAMELAFDKRDLRIRLAEMYMDLNEYASVEKVLEGNDDALSQIIRLEVAFRTTREGKRPKNNLEKLKLGTSYERARADYLWAESEDANGVWGKAADKYSEAISELNNSTRRRDHVLQAELYRQRAMSLFKVSKQNLAKVNEDFESGMELLIKIDDGTAEIRHLMETIEVEKARCNSEQPVEAQPIASTMMLNTIMEFGGRQYTVSGPPIGEGGNYNVYMATDNSVKYAVRIPSKINPYESKTAALTREEMIRINSEEEIWSELSNSCPEKVVQLVGTSTGKYPAQLMEYADTNFSKVESSLSIKERVDVVIRLLDCIQEVHDIGVVHNDIKPDNLLQVGGVWKLADFDTAFAEGEPVTNPRGTFEYMSPEQFGAGEITSKSDVWAAGVMLCHSLHRRFPFDGRESEYRQNVLNGNFNDGGVNPRFVPILRRVFAVDPDERPTAAEFASELRKINGESKESVE